MKLLKTFKAKSQTKECIDQDIIDSPGDRNGLLKTQVRVDVTVLSLKSAGQANKLETQAGFLSML